MKYQTIFWDWNGTLFDDVQAALASVNDILSRRGRPPLTLEQYYEYVDTPIIRFYESLFDLRVDPFEELAQEFHEGYRNHRQHFGLADGAAALLADCHAQGVRQIILSSAYQQHLNEFTSLFSISCYFDAVLGADDFYAHSKMERARLFLSEHAVDPASAVVIGDTLHDAEVASSLGMDCILVTWGHQPRRILAPTGASMAETIDQIRTLLADKR